MPSKVEFKINGRKVSPSQLGREMQKAVEAHIEDELRKAAGPGVKMRKTSQGYEFEGSPEEIERLTRRLG